MCSGFMFRTSIIDDSNIKRPIYLKGILYSIYKANYVNMHISISVEEKFINVLINPLTELK